MSKSVQFAGLLALVAATSVARAAEEPATKKSAADTPAPAGVAEIDAQALFDELDANGDGLLVTDEVSEAKQSLYDRLVRLGDGNGDGKLSAVEFAVGLSGGEKQPAAREKPSDADKSPAKARPGRPGKAVRPEPGQFLARFDANGDGKLSVDEVPEPRREAFARLVAKRDKDGDGALSPAEMPSPAAAPPGKPTKAINASVAKPRAGRDPAELFKRIDRNADGKIVADEAPEPRREVLSRMIERGDKDNDQALSRDEFTAVMNRIRKNARPAKPAGASNDAKKKSAAKRAKKANKKKPPAAAMPAGLFKALDANADGQLSAAEIEAASAAILKLDRNGDGTVSAREVALTARKKPKQPKKP